MGGTFDKLSYDEINTNKSEEIGDTQEDKVRKLREKEENRIPTYEEFCKDQDFQGFLEYVEFYRKVIDSNYPLYNNYAILAKIEKFTLPYGKLIYTGRIYDISDSYFYILTLEDINSLVNIGGEYLSKVGPEEYNFFNHPEFIVANITYFQAMVDICDFLKTNTTKSNREIRDEIDNQIKNFEDDTNKYVRLLNIAQLGEIFKTEKLP